jgi:hypothetical protein
MGDECEVCNNECEGVIKKLPKSTDLEAIVTHDAQLSSKTAQFPVSRTL